MEMKMKNLMWKAAGFGLKICTKIILYLSKGKMKNKIFYKIFKNCLILTAINKY